MTEPINTDLKIYNSLSRTKENFVPLKPGFIGMYVCGPTVYSRIHLGNLRTFISFDIVFRYLKHLGFVVRYVRNITDAGHLEYDEDSGENRIAKKAKVEQIEPMEVVQMYTVDFHTILGKFNLLPPSIEPTATGHIIEQIEIIKKILENGFAYEVNGSVYFDVIKFHKTNTYGKLSGRDLEDLIHNKRDLDGQTDKKNPQDFALWKKAQPEHIMRWSSPWSDGFPGWHLECTAMSTKYLGTQFDIHGGGMDLKFPHHECEIAQSEIASGQSPVNYWMHANMLTLNGQKMAKSTGNYLLPKELITGENTMLSKAFSPSVVRFFMLQAHYRSVLDFSNKALEASEKGYYKLMDAYNLLNKLPFSGSTKGFDVFKWKNNCYKALNDDFNTPILIAELFRAVKFINLVKDNRASIAETELNFLKTSMQKFVFEVLGLGFEEQTNNEQSDKLRLLIELLIKLRSEARSHNNYTLSDKIRDQLKTIGIQLKDAENGTTFTID